MILNVFKKTLSDLFIESGLKKSGSVYRFENPELTVLIDVQRSRFDSSYFINVGYLIPALHEYSESLKVQHCDVRLRFGFWHNGAIIDSYDLATKDNLEDLRRQIEANLNRYVKPMITINDLRNLLNERPELLYLTTLRTKEFLKII